MPGITGTKSDCGQILLFFSSQNRGFEQKYLCSGYLMYLSLKNDKFKKKNVFDQIPCLKAPKNAKKKAGHIDPL